MLMVITEIVLLENLETHIMTSYDISYHENNEIYLKYSHKYMCVYKVKGSHRGNINLFTCPNSRVT